MYMLWGGGAPFSKKTDSTLVDCSGSSVKMLGAVPEILLELKTDDRWKDAVVAIASCTDEPSWAQDCLRMFEIGDGYCIKDVMHHEEIYKSNKQKHLRNLAEKTGIALEDMLFLDNEMGNCQSVASIGVTVAYTPKGVTAQIWEKAIANFPAPGNIIRP
eukprot:CAMPEP_0171314312 /NCGR_PEP_ID=MMETSP0816-20121228/50224_1 /TAXON_ID=420281 /ORGANISM="Proboscia inermis, Strain CCAP1064/1" /LENGTH=158 /DNA_ID=CAMNT_0011803055 /DNA_START=245 /DNA_END=721 /DNA_ORIENTATION=+